MCEYETLHDKKWLKVNNIYFIYKIKQIQDY